MGGGRGWGDDGGDTVMEREWPASVNDWSSINKETTRHRAAGRGREMSPSLWAAF